MNSDALENSIFSNSIPMKFTEHREIEQKTTTKRDKKQTERRNQHTKYTKIWSI